MTVLTVLVVGLLLVVVLLVVASCLLRANRLDRLHVRTDAALAALVAALERRAVVARSVGLQPGAAEDAELLRLTAARTESVPPPEREAAENDLSEQLGRVRRGGLPLELATELADAEQRVMLARRVHNDAVRDTLALRSRRLVRWLRLAGTAPEPGYFEIVDAGRDGEDGSPLLPRLRAAGRVVLLDPDGRVLLFEGHDPARPQERYWFTPGGGVAPGESGRTAAQRVLAEQTGLRLPAEELVGPVWRRRAMFSVGGENVASDEEFFLVRMGARRMDRRPVDAATGPGTGTGLVAGSVLGHRWWSEQELRGTGAVSYPRKLDDLLGRLRGDDWDGVTRTVS